MSKHVTWIGLCAGLAMACGGEKKSAPKASGAGMQAAPRPRLARRPPRRRARRPPARRTARPAVAKAPTAECRRKGPVQRLDLARLSGVSFWGRQGKVRRAVWRKRAPFLGDDGQVQKVKGGHLAAWVRPERGSMWRHPVVGEARRKGLGFVGQRRVQLARGWEGTALKGTAVRDLDGDGRPEFLVWYTWVGQPERAVGSREVEYLAVVDLKGPRLQGLVELGRGGQAEVHPKCTAVLRVGDLRCAGKPSLYVTRTCKVLGLSAPSQEPRTETEWTTVELRYDPAEDRYAPEAVFGAPGKVAPVKDGKPWLVVAASVPGGLWGARAVADKKRQTLVRRGFPQASVHPSPAFPMLRDGYWVVVAGRHATRAAARKQVAALKAKRIQAYARQGF